MRSSYSEDGADGDALRETVAVALPWWLGDTLPLLVRSLCGERKTVIKAKRLGITLILGGQVAVDVGRDLVS